MNKLVNESGTRNNQVSIIECLDIFLKYRYQNDQGQFRLNRSRDGLLAEDVLISLVQFKKNYSIGIKETIVSKAIFRWIKYKTDYLTKQKYTSFVRAVEKEARDFTRKRETYTILFFLAHDFFKDLPREKIVVLGETLYWITRKELNTLIPSSLLALMYSEFGPLGLLGKWGDQHYDWDYFSYLPSKLEVIAETEDEALLKSLFHLNLLRFSINFPALENKYPRLSDFGKQLTFLTPSPAYFIFNSKGIQQKAYKSRPNEIPHRPFVVNKLTEENIKWLELFANHTLGDSSSWDFLFGLMEMFQDAMDACDSNSAFLKYFQLLEVGVKFGRKEQDENFSVIKNRLLRTIEATALEVQAINLIFKARNTTVHTGKSPFHYGHIVNTTKSICEKLIRRILEVVEVYPDLVDLRTYFALAMENKNELLRKKAILGRMISE